MPRKPSLAETRHPAWLRALPKVELHLHLEGTTDPETLVALSRRHDATPLTLADARALYTYRDFLGFLEAYKAMSSRLRTPEDYELITYNMVRALAAQGVVHAEVYISFGIIYFWNKAEVEPYVEAIERGRLRAEQEFGTTIYWLIDAVRHFGAEEAARVFRKAAELRAQYPSIVGIGIGGDEARGPASLFQATSTPKPAPPASASPPTPASPAAPSTAPPASGPPSTSAPNASATASPPSTTPNSSKSSPKSRSPSRLNVTSNIRTGCCTSFDAHPLRRYFDSGLMVTLNSDDPPMFGANLLDEYILAHDALRLHPRPAPRTRRQRRRSQLPPAHPQTRPPRPHRAIPLAGRDGVQVLLPFLRLSPKKQ